jgi:hypothetical protein
VFILVNHTANDYHSAYYSIATNITIRSSVKQAMKTLSRGSAYFQVDSSQHCSKLLPNSNTSYKENEPKFKSSAISFPLTRDVLWDRHPISRAYYLKADEIIPPLFLSDDAIKKILTNIIEYGAYDGKFISVKSSLLSQPINHPTTATHSPTFVITSLDDVQPSSDYYSTSSIDLANLDTKCRVITVPIEAQPSSENLHFDDLVE